MNDQHIEDLLSEPAIQPSLKTAGIETTLSAEAHRRLLDTGGRYELWRALQRVAFDHSDYEYVLRRLAKAGLAVVLRHWPGEPPPTQLLLLLEPPVVRQRRAECRRTGRKAGVPRQKPASGVNGRKRRNRPSDARSAT